MTYKCWSCLYRFTANHSIKRQPLCPRCPHHPRMYPVEEIFDTGWLWCEVHGQAWNPIDWGDSCPNCQEEKVGV
jgi:Zn finger protein HypA/HybF involved in hydrogenase expression